MTKKEGMLLLDSVMDNLKGAYTTLEELYGQVRKPVPADVQEKTDEILKRALNVAVAALNFKELPPQAKKPMAALLYAAADALGDDDND